ncbi:MAG: MOSC domain-containing protein [bacterium]
MNNLISNKGKIRAISVSKKKGTPKMNIDSAVLIENRGIEGDAHAGDWHRQISLLAIESIDKMRQKDLIKLRPGIFAENLTTEFINLPKLPIGTQLLIGENSLLEITQIGKECHTRCAIFETVGDCVMPREGIFAKVIKGGIIKVNDDVRILNKD